MTPQEIAARRKTAGSVTSHAEKMSRTTRMSMAASPRAKRSCLLVNTVLELARQNKAVQKRVTRHLDTLEALFRRALETAQANGELSADKDPKALAAFLMCNIWGLRVLGGTAPTPKRTQAVVRQLLAVLA